MVGWRNYLPLPKLKSLVFGQVINLLILPALRIKISATSDVIAFRDVKFADLGGKIPAVSAP